ncbi:MAG: alpha/beta hydrolase [Terrimicrobiaceae bacterium]|nr:alpha/beta hydrolase [Terrimicrobiaceae bacterium]
MTTFILDGIWGGHTRWEPLRVRLAREVGPTRIWPYDNSGRTSLTTLAARLVDELERCESGFHLVGYSMGGIVIREAIRQRADLPVGRAALLHSPHAGSWAAAAMPFVACQEMRPGSRFLARLNACDWTIPTFATWCPGDLMIIPGHSARWERATILRECRLPAHAWPVFSRRLHREIAEFLRDGAAETGT